MSETATHSPDLYRRAYKLAEKGLPENTWQRPFSDESWRAGRGEPFHKNLTKTFNLSSRYFNAWLELLSASRVLG